MGADAEAAMGEAGGTGEDGERGRGSWREGTAKVRWREEDSGGGGGEGERE